MKKLIITLFAIASVFITLGQVKSDTSKHLTFKGVPINGTLTEYVDKMKKSGFTAKGIQDGVALLEGEFASYKNCIVLVNTLKKKDLVSNIVVAFPNRKDWSSLSSNYFNLKELLTEKYGKPSEVVEEFQSFTPDNDGSKMTAVELDHCKYYTTYETDRGTIQLSIDLDERRNAFVKLAYYDKINYDSVRKQALDDL